MKSYQLPTFLALTLALLFSLSASAQISVKVQDSIAEPADFLALDALDHIYFVKSVAIKKVTPQRTYNFADFLNGRITSIDVSNPLNVMVFYKDTQKIVFLDNRLNEIRSIDLNTIDGFFDHAARADERNVYLHDATSNEVVVYDYAFAKAITKTIPYKREILDLIADYNFFYVLQEDRVLRFNNYGSQTHTFKTPGALRIGVTDDLLIYQSPDGFYALDIPTEKVTRLQVKEKQASGFFLSPQFLYIYGLFNRVKYQIITD